MTAGIWERWAERVELGIELSPVAHAEYQAALFSARKYMEMRHGESQHVVATGPLSCAGCGHVFASSDSQGLRATELSARLLGHACTDKTPGQEH